MAAATDNMRILIDNLLEFSKISRSNEAFVLSDLNVVMEEAKGELELKIEETGAEIMQDDLPFIVCNPLQIRQLFVNLLSNSLKFRKKDRKTIIRIGSRPATVEEKAAEKLPVDQVYYWITIADNGIGFEKEYAERIFLIFQRLHGKSEYPGSGIGLAICKKIADQHHGVIRAEGRPGDGAVFIVILPKGTRD
jgi:light-regulated signal transduction histidine kinase (bacteriophytochrome)